MIRNKSQEIVPDFNKVFRDSLTSIFVFVRTNALLVRNVAGLANLIEDTTASDIVYWIICVAIMAVLILAILIGVGLVLIRYGRYVRENQWDRHTVTVITIDIAVTLFLAEHIRALIPINLVVIQAVIQLLYSLIRARIRHVRSVY